MRKELILLCLLALLSISSYPQNSAIGGGSIIGGGTLSSTPTHSVTLTWVASPSSGVIGYNIYRSQTSVGPYTKLNNTVIAGTSYSDITVSAGQTYYYVATTVGQGSVESAYSSQVSALIPTP